jgi:hypothetical protein
MVFVELENPDDLTNFLNEHNDVCIITFSATWCGVRFFFFEFVFALE